jgi:hypothetical protein
MTEEKLTREWLEQKLAADHVAEEKAELEKTEEQAQEEARQAYIEVNGTEPTSAELDALVRETRAQETLDRLAANRRQAAHQVRQMF